MVKAVDTKTQQEVAIKLSNMELVKAGETVNRFRVIENTLSEARIMRLLLSSPHPNIHPMIDEHLQGNVRWIITPFMPMGDLFDLLEAQHQFSAQTARIYFRQMLSAVQHLHARNICHLDCSLENMLVDSKLNVQLTDFGVAADLSGRERPVRLIFHPRGKPGKMSYLAPEALLQIPADPYAMDLFALGVCLFMMLLGCRPFEKASRYDARYLLIQEGQLDSLFRTWSVLDRVGDQATDLLQNMLYLQSKRFTLEQVLAHPWLKPQTTSEVNGESRASSLVSSEKGIP
jgi:serine/threonine protein kinase